MSRTWFSTFAVRGIILATSLAGQLVSPTAADGQAAPSANSGSPAARQATQSRPATTASAGEPVQVRKSGTDHTRLIYRASALPVFDLTNTINQLFAAEGKLQSPRAAEGNGSPSISVAIATSIVSNSLIISGPPDAVEEVRKLLEGLDQPLSQVMLDVEIGEAPVGVDDETKEAAAPEPGEQDNTLVEQWRWAQRPAQMTTIGRVQLTTLDNQPAFAQMGARVPMVVGVSKSADGEEIRNASLINVGLIVAVTPRITPSGSVVMEIDAEQSQLGPEAEGVPISITGDKVVRTPQVNTTSIQSTVTVSGGQSVILGAVTPRGQADKALIVVITPHIIAPGETPPAPQRIP